MDISIVYISIVKLRQNKEVVDMLVLLDSVCSVIPVSLVSPFPTDICSMRKEREGIAPPVYLLSISSSPLKVSGNPSSVSSRSSLSGGAPFLVTGGSVILGITEGVKGKVLTVTVCTCKCKKHGVKQYRYRGISVEGFSGIFFFLHFPFTLFFSVLLSNVRYPAQNSNLAAFQRYFDAIFLQLYNCLKMLDFYLEI